jgi:hypothetical protein
VSAFVVLGRVRLFDRCLVVVEVDGTVGSEVERAAGVVVVGVGISSSPVEGGELGEVGVVVYGGLEPVIGEEGVSAGEVGGKVSLGLLLLWATDGEEVEESEEEGVPSISAVTEVPMEGVDLVAGEAGEDCEQ